jgi:hypothetical protein
MDKLFPVPCLSTRLHTLPHRSIAVCFTPVSGIDSRSQALPSRAISGLLHRSKHGPYWMVLEASTIRGSRMVKVEPWPGSLAAVISPPII